MSSFGWMRKTKMLRRHGTLCAWYVEELDDQQMKENIRVDMRVVLDFLSDIARGVRYAHEKYKMIVRNLQSSKIL